MIHLTDPLPPIERVEEPGRDAAIWNVERPLPQLANFRLGS
jgi:hypothetical protein